MPIRFVALSLVMLLTACARYNYISPQTPEGLACEHKLDAEVSACETRIKAQQDIADGLHDLQTRNTQQCQQVNTLNIPNACPPLPSPTKVTNDCRNGYAKRFIACGGRIEKIEQ